MPEARDFAFVGARWTNEMHTGAAPTASPNTTSREAWAFVVSGHLKGKPTAFDGYNVIVHNLRTNSIILLPRCKVSISPLQLQTSLGEV